MFYQMITNARNRWFASSECTAQGIIAYIEKANQSLEADHIKIYQTTGRGIEIKGKEFDLRRVLVRENRKIVMKRKTGLRMKHLRIIGSNQSFMEDW